MRPQLGPEAADKEGPAIPISFRPVSQGCGLPWKGGQRECAERPADGWRSGSREPGPGDLAQTEELALCEAAVSALRG